MSTLFSPLTLRGQTFRNRLWIAPMCQYSATDGLPNDWHLVHLGQFAAGGFGLVIAEASGVSPEGRITPADTGIWNDEQQAAWARIVAFLHSQDTAAGIQLAHAGRKASTERPWDGNGSVPDDRGGWDAVAPSAVAFPGYDTPTALDQAGLRRVVDDFAAATRRALAAGFDVVEVHAAHGYLLHEFLSPLSNTRTDGYGGDFEGRTRLLLEVVDAVRAAWPADKALFVRLSATDWVEGGWSADETVRLSALLRDRGVDLVDTSTGGNAPASIPVGPGYQVPFAERVRREAGVAAAAVGIVVEAKQAEDIVSTGAADAVLLAREALRDPHAALRWAEQLGAEVRWPLQYDRARPFERA